MRESVLAGRLGVSRPTTREALHHLVREGLLTHQMHRGMVVTELGEDDIQDLYNVRLVLESAGISSTRGRKLPLDVSRGSIASLVQAIELRDSLGIVDADMAFHTSLVAFAGSKRLTQFHTAAIGQLRLALGRMDMAYGDLDRQVREHRRLLKEIERNQVDSALQHLHGHLVRASANLSRFIRENSG